MIHNILRLGCRWAGMFLGMAAIIGRSFEAVNLPTATWFVAAACFLLLMSRDDGTKGEG